jgi:hypothetical protein
MVALTNKNSPPFVFYEKQNRPTVVFQSMDSSTQLVTQMSVGYDILGIVAGVTLL